MPSVDTIKFARTIGLENISELNKLKKLIKGAKVSSPAEPLVAEAKLSLTTEQYEALQKLYTQRFNVPTNASDIVRQYSPATFASGNRFNTNLKVQKLGPSSGKVEVAVSDTAGTVDSKVKLVGNDAGFRATMSGGTKGLSNGTVDAVYLKDNPEIKPFDIARSIQYSEADGVTRMTIPGNVKGGLRVKADVGMKTEAIDAITSQSSGGQITKFSDLIEQSNKELL
jgi:hypothetical protein